MKRSASLFVLVGILTMFVLPMIPAMLPAPVPVDRPVLRSSHAWGGLVDTAPFAIASDADWVTYAASGSGTAGDPWIIENMLVEADGAGRCISITGTTNHAIIRNCFINESGAGGTDAGIFMQAVSNVDVLNCTLEQDGNRQIIIVASSNVTVTGCTLQDTPVGGNGVYIDGSNNVLIQGTIFFNITASPDRNAVLLNDGFAGDNTHVSIVNCTFLEIQGDPIFTPNTSPTNGGDFLVENCSFSGTTLEGVHFFNAANITIRGNDFINSTDMNIGMSEVDNATIEGNTFSYTANLYSINLADCTDFTINDNTFAQHAISGIYGAGIADFIIHGNTFNESIDISDGIGSVPRSTNVTIDSNTFDSVHATDINLIGDHVDITNNTFTDSTEVLYLSADHAVNVSGNYFIGCATYLDATGSVFTWDSNAYHEYFDAFPFDVTDNVTTSILENEFRLNATLNDTRPVYAAWLYPRSTMIYLNFYSNVDGMGIPFANLRVLLNSVPLTVTYPVIPAVLYRLTVSDFRGRALYDEMLNLNDTGIYVDIGLDIAVQIFVSYSSNLDAFGFDFSLAKLYIDGARCAIFNPIMDHEMILFTVRDFANRVLYNQTWNLTVTGVYVDIGLNITTLVIHNSFGYAVVFHYMIAGIENSFPLAAGQYVDIRVALGTYSWWITDTRNRPIEDADGDEIVGSKSVTGPNVIDFGWTSVSPGPVNTYTTSLLDYAIVIGMLGAAFTVTIALMLRVPKKAKKSTYDRPRR